MLNGNRETKEGKSDTIKKSGGNMINKRVISGIISALLVMGLISTDLSLADASTILPSAQNKYNATMKSIYQAIQSYDLSELATITTFNDTLLARDSAVTTALRAAWNPNSGEAYSDTATQYLPLVNAWIDAEIASTRTRTTLYLFSVRQRMANELYNFGVAGSAYAHQVKLSAAGHSKSAMKKSVALYNARVKAMAKARDDKANALEQSNRSALDSYEKAAKAAFDAFYNPWEEKNLGFYDFGHSTRSSTTKTTLDAFDASYTSAFSTYTASKRANLSQLQSALTSVASSIPKLANTANEALAAAYIDAAK